MRQVAILYNGKIDVAEYPGVVLKNPVLLKPIYVYIGEVEKNILTGKLPVNKSIILGCTGVARIIEVYSGSTEYTGRVFIISPFGAQGILGVEEDGLLSNYSSIHPSYLDEIVLEPKPIDAIKPLVKHAETLSQRVMEPVLIEGCNLVSLALGLSLRYKGIEPAFYCENTARSVIQFGFRVFKHPSELVDQWGSIVLTSHDHTAKYKLLSQLVYNNIVVSPLSFTNWIPLTKREGVYNVSIAYRDSVVDNTVVRRVLDTLSKSIRIVEVDDLKNAIGLFPPRGLGLILSLK